MPTVPTHDESIQRRLDKMLREEARKRDYGQGIPKWSVYYHAEAPKHNAAPAVGRAAQQSRRSRTQRQRDMNTSFRVKGMDFVQEAHKTLSRGNDEDMYPRIDPTDAACTTLIEACDADGDGMIDVGELVNVLEARPHLLKPLGIAGSSTETQIYQMFSKADKDGSGQVDRAELIEFLKSVKGGKHGIEGMDHYVQEVDEAKPLEPPNRNFGVPLVSRPGSAHYSSGKRHPQNHVCRNEFFTMGAMPGENANVVASGYFKTIGRPFEGQWATNTCQKPRSLGKGQEWTSEIQPTCAPYRRTHAWSVPRYGDALQQDGRSLRERARLSANFKI